MVNIQQLDQQILYLQSQLHTVPNPPQTQQQATVVAQLQAQLNHAYAQKQQLLMQQQVYGQQMGYQQQPYQQQMYQQPVYQQPQQPSQYGSYNNNAGFAQPYNQPTQPRGYQTQVNHGNTSRYGDRLKEMKETRIKEEQKYMAPVQQQPEVVKPIEPMWFPGHELGYICSPNVMEKHVVENGLTKRELVSSGKNIPLDKLKLKRGKKEMNINTCTQDIYNLYPNEVRTHDAFDVTGVEKVYDILNYEDEMSGVDKLNELLPMLDKSNIVTFLSIVPKVSKKFRRELDIRYTHLFNNMLYVKGVTNLSIDNLVTDIPDYIKYMEQHDNLKTKKILNNVLDMLINDIKTKLTLTVLERGNDNTGILEIKFTGDLMVINNDSIGSIIKQQVLENEQPVAKVTEESFPEITDAVKAHLSPNLFKDLVATNHGHETRYKVAMSENSVGELEAMIMKIPEMDKEEVIKLLDKIGI